MSRPAVVWTSGKGSCTLIPGLMRRLRRDVTAVVQPVQAIANNSITERESGMDDCETALRTVDLHGALLYRTVRMDHKNEVTLSSMLKGGGGNEQRVTEDLGLYMNVYKLIGKQQFIFIGKYGF